MSLRKYIDAFAKLNTNKNKNKWGKNTYHCAPHKPLLLFATIDRFVERAYPINLIKFDDDLSNLFSIYWTLVEPPSIRGNIVMPLYHLQSDGFWHLLPRKGYEAHLKYGGNIHSLRKLKKTVYGAKLDDDLYELLQQQEARDSLRTVLIDTYFAPELRPRLVQQGKINRESYFYSQDLLASAVERKVKETAVHTENNADAYQLLAGIIRNNPKNVHAWFMLSQVVEQKDRQIECLHRVLHFAPDHSPARKRLSQLETSPAQRITRIQSFNPIPKSTLSTHTLEPVVDNQSFDLHDTSPTPSETDNQTGIEKFPDVVELLFEDVARLPIITSPHQELWLGIQLKSVQRWCSFTANNDLHNMTNDAVCLSICTALAEKHQIWEALCLEHDVQPPQAAIWIGELLSARGNIYQLKQSRLRRFIRRAQKRAGADAGNRFLEAAGSVGEMLCWLPDNALLQIMGYAQTHEQLPPANKMSQWLAHATLSALTEKIERRANNAEKTLITGYLRYVLRVAQGYIGKGVAYTDLVQEGFKGLMRAVKKFDYQIQTRFGSYATSWIWQAIGRAVADQARTIRIPVHLQEELRKYEQACSRFDTGIGKCATNSAILFRADLLEEKDFQKIQRAADANAALPEAVRERFEKAAQRARMLEFARQPTIPLDFGRPPSEMPLDAEDAILEMIADSIDTLPEIIVDRQMTPPIVEQRVIARLKPREKEVLALRYGFEDGEERTLQEVGRLFNLTRERIRQIETNALKKLNNQRKKRLLPDLYDLLPDETLFSDVIGRLPAYPAHTEHLFKREESDDERHRINMLLESLPRSTWHEGRHVGQDGDMREKQIINALYASSAPAHFSDIAEQVNEEIQGKPLDEQYVYSILAQREKSFILLGQGVFSLVAWERKRAKKENPTLPFCPALLPDPPDYGDAFFESVLVGREKLSGNLTADQFLNQMFRWAHADLEQQKWFRQTVLSAYYLVGLIPYVSQFGDDNPVLTCTLPDLNIQELRYYCLQTLTERLTAMPEFWWLFQKEQPARPSHLGEEFADIHPNGLDDVLHRLRILAGLGAAQKLKYGRYSLTPFGKKCARMWQKQPELEINLTAEPDFESDLMDFAIWE